MSFLKNQGSIPTYLIGISRRLWLISPALKLEKSQAREFARFVMDRISFVNGVQSERPTPRRLRQHDVPVGIEGIRVHGKHAAGGGVTKDGGVVSAECLESISYGGLKSEKT